MSHHPARSGLTAAQAAQQDNRDTGGKYASKTHSAPGAAARLAPRVAPEVEEVLRARGALHDASRAERAASQRLARSFEFPPAKAFARRRAQDARARLNEASRALAIAEARLARAEAETARPTGSLAGLPVPRGARATNTVSEPILAEDGIHSFGGSCGSQGAPDAPGGHGDIPGRGHVFSASVAGKDLAVLASVRGVARTHQEGWDRIRAFNKAWADQYDKRPSRTQVLTEIERHRASTGNADLTAREDAACAARLAAADDLDAAIAARAALPRHGLTPSTRAQVADAEAAVQSAWVEYQRHYDVEAPA